MLEIIAESTRNEEVAESVHALSDEGRKGLHEFTSDYSNVDDLNERVEIVLALAKGLGLQNLINSEIDREKIKSLVGEIVSTLFPKKNTNSIKQ